MMRLGAACAGEASRERARLDARRRCRVDAGHESSAERPQPVPREADVAADLQLVIAELEDKHPADVALLQQLQSPTVDDAKACAVVASFYETILQLPPDNSGKLLRYLLSQG